ncbi:MAG: hypothetical protein WC462_03905 [archaeon]
MSRAQGTVEYLIIVGVIVVLSLVVVGLFSTQTDSAQGVSVSAQKLASSSGSISISEAVVDVSGDGLITFSNYSGENFFVTGINVGGVDVNYNNIFVAQGEKKTFNLKGVESGCSCVGFEGKTRTCEIRINIESINGLDKSFSTSVSVDCVGSVIPKDPGIVVFESSLYGITFDIKDSLDEFPLTDFNMDCEGSAYDLIEEDSPVTMDINAGNYSCVLSKEGYDSSTESIVVDNNKSLTIYLDPVSISLSACGTLSEEDGYYVLTQNIGSGGECLIIDANNIRINGADFTVTGDINASATSGYCEFNDPYCNTSESDCVYGCGSTWVSETQRDFSLYNIIFDGGVYSYGGSDVAIVDSIVSSLTLTGNSGRDGDMYGGTGTVSGSISLSSSSVLGAISSVGGNGGASSWDTGGAGGAVSTTIISDSIVSGAISLSGGNGGIGSMTGGAGGAVGILTITDSTISGSINSIGGNGGTAYDSGGAGGTSGAITVTDSSVSGAIISNGGDGQSGNYSSGVGGDAGSIALDNVTGLTDVNSIGGDSYSTAGDGGNITFAMPCPEIMPSSIISLGGMVPASPEHCSLNDPWCNESEDNCVNGCGSTWLPATPLTYGESGTIYPPVGMCNAKMITDFSLVGAGSVDVIDEENHTISVTVSPTTDLSSLVTNITIVGISVSPASGVAQDFTSPVTFTVTSADSSTQGYLVTVTHRDFSPVSNCVELQDMNSCLVCDYVLMNDINCYDDTQVSGGYLYNGGSGFLPVGNDTNKFTGSFDGNHYTISNLYINRSSLQGVGLFGYTNEALISNVNIVGGNFISAGHFGPLIGHATDTTISRCYSQVSISTCGAFVWGSNLGGLVGSMYGGTMTESYVGGSLYCQNGCVGGLTGYMEGGTINNSYATGTVGSGREGTGGVVGCTNVTNATISNSYSTGNVSAGYQGYPGGIVGIGVWGPSTITNCFTTGTMSGSNSGGIVAGSSLVTVTNSYRLFTGTYNLGTLEGGGASAFYNSSHAVYTGSPAWDFVNVWDICEGTSLPTLKWENRTC